jgi:hypothetical protein
LKFLDAFKSREKLQIYISESAANEFLQREVELLQLKQMLGNRAEEIKRLTGPVSFSDLGK